MIEGRPEEARPVRSTTDANVGLSFRLAQLIVLSRALAHAAHDVQNHLATINESAGWMADLLKLKSKQRFGRIARFFKRNQSQRFDAKPFLESLNTIQEQVVQGARLTQDLSSFAHRLEETRSVFNGNKALEEIRGALLRQASQKGIRLELKLAKEAPMIETDPPVFQWALFASVEQVMEGVESGGWLALGTEVSGGRFQVHLTSPCPKESLVLLQKESSGPDFSRDIIEELGGKIWSQSSHGEHVTTLDFPLAGGKT
jgi:hypothetical protein